MSIPKAGGRDYCRLFGRITRLTPGDYRRKFRMPELPGPVEFSI
jgi:hypothetical protein